MSTRDVFAEGLAGADADDQAAFLNVFVRALNVFCKASPYGSATIQAHYIAKVLHQDTVVFLKDLVETHAYFRTEYSDEVVRDRYDRIRKLDAEIETKRLAAAIDTTYPEP